MSIKRSIIIIQYTHTCAWTHICILIYIAKSSGCLAITVTLFQSHWNCYNYDLQHVASIQLHVYQACEEPPHTIKQYITNYNIILPHACMQS